MKTLNDLAPGKTVLARIDINSPVEDGDVKDNERFARHAETVTQLADNDHGVALLAHQGRPGRDTFVPLEQHAQILSQHTGIDVQYVDDIHGEKAITTVKNLEAGEVALLENVRMSEYELAELSPEEHAQNGFVSQLAPHVDAYVNDAYSAAHRGHASLVGFPQVLDSYAGTVMHTEHRHNSMIHDRVDENVAMVVGGKKAEDVVHVMDALKETVDDFVVGGLIAELFLRAKGFDVGYDVRPEETFMHEQWLQNRDKITALLDTHGDKIHLPKDLAYHNGQRRREEVLVKDAAKTDPYWDVGKQTVESFRPIIEDADAVFVKGALGVFEDEKFSYGTRQILKTIAHANNFSVVGGGDTSRAIDLYGFDPDRFNHVSIAGGAYIRALTGEPLPAIEALSR